jgi:hypothetical protein
MHHVSTAAVVSWPAMRTSGHRAAACLSRPRRAGHEETQRAGVLHLQRVLTLTRSLVIYKAATSSEIRIPTELGLAGADLAAGTQYPINCEVQLSEAGDDGGGVGQRQGRRPWRYYCQLPSGQRSPLTDACRPAPLTVKTLLHGAFWIVRFLGG